MEYLRFGLGSGKMGMVWMLCRAINDAERAGRGIGLTATVGEHQDVVTWLFEHIQILTQETKISPPLQTDVKFPLPPRSVLHLTALSKLTAHYHTLEARTKEGEEGRIICSSWRSPPFNAGQEEEMKFIHLKCFDI